MPDETYSEHQPAQSIITTSATALDEQWYVRLEPILDQMGEVFVALMPSDEKLQRLHSEFVASNYTRISDLYPEQVDLSACKARLHDLRQEILDTEQNVAIRDAYSVRIDEQLRIIDMITAAQTGDVAAYQAANHDLYGSPDYEIFAAVCSWIRRDAQQDHGTMVSNELRDAVLRLIPDVQGDASLLTPSDEVFQTVKALHFKPGGYIDQLFAAAPVPNSSKITPQIGDPIVRQVIQNVHSTFNLADSAQGIWSVLHSKHQVVRPAHYTLERASFMGIVCHEIGSHLLESTNGAVSSLKLLEVGLDRYEHGNEGRAFLREQIMYDRVQDYIDQPNWSPTKSSWEYSVALHLIVSLASGTYERSYNFAEVYHLLTVLFEFWTAKRGEPIDADIIASGAWNMATRALKGTNGNGGAYLKDIVYLEGNLRCWQLAATRPELLLYGDKGKFDITNPRHIQILTQLGMLPATAPQ